MESDLGSTVGYSIRFEDVTSKDTRIKFMTDGTLLRELLSDRLLRKYSVVILDEAHERTLRTDVLFGMMKKIMDKRKDLKVVIMSATLNAEKFSKYFNQAKVLNVEGRQHEVKLMVTREPQSDYIDACLISLFQIHKEMPKGDILVFLTGQEEIESVEKLLKQNLTSLPKNCMKMMILPLFANLPTAQQTQIFDATPSGCRKVVLATNIAETSITIPGIRYVIDCGLRKTRSYIARTGVDTLAVNPISKASARQRAGRAGREAPGICFRLYTERAFKSLDDDDEPEIKRCSLSNVLLLLKASGVEDVINFDFIDKPCRDSLVASLEQLLALGSLDDKQNLTPLGKRMASFPLDPPFSRVLIESSSFGCTREIIDIISLLSVETLFYTAQNQRDEALEARKVFISNDGDVLTLFNVLQGYLATSDKDSEWLKQHFINTRSLKHVMDIRKQLLEYADKNKDLLDTNPKEEAKKMPLTERILCSFLSGFFTKVAVKQQDGSYKSLFNHQILYIHPSSVLFNVKPDVVLFTEVTLTTKQYMRNLSRVDLQWLKLIDQKYVDI